MNAAKGATILVIVLGVALFAVSARAEITKKIALSSTPVGAEVFLVRGRKETSLGKTPLKTDLTFHSDVSVLRLGFKKPGFESLQIKVRAADTKVHASLRKTTLTASPRQLAFPELQPLQERLNPIIEKELPGLLPNVQNLGFEVAAPIRVTKLGGKTYAVLPIDLQVVELPSALTGKERRGAFIDAVWKETGTTLLLPLLKALSAESQLDGVLLDAGYDDLRYNFAVNASVQIHTEMECVSGYRYEQQWDGCAYYVNGVCQSGMKTVTIYDPCMTQIAVTKSELKVDPTAATRRETGKLQIVLPRGAISEGEAQAAAAAILLLTARDGSVLESRGPVPPGLPKIR